MKRIGKGMVLGACRFLENFFWGLGDFFEYWGDHFDDNLRARLRRVLAEFNRGRKSGIEICPYCDTILSDQVNEMEGLTSITAQPCRCPCGWSGTVRDCEADVEGDRDLVCPECLRLIEGI